MKTKKTNPGLLLFEIFLMYGNMLLMMPPIIAAFFKVPDVPLMPFTMLFVASLLMGSWGMYLFGRDWVR